VATNVNVQRAGTVDNTDVLAGTDLENLPGPGVLSIYGVSTAVDTALTVTPPGEQSSARAFTLTTKAAATVNANDDQPLAIIAINTSGRVIVFVDITAAATWAMLFVYTPAEDFAGV